MAGAPAAARPSRRTGRPTTVANAYLRPAVRALTTGFPALGPGRGKPGCRGGELALARRSEQAAKRLPDKCTIRLNPGDVLRMLTPGGGGWGEPEEGACWRTAIAI